MAFTYIQGNRNSNDVENPTVAVTLSPTAGNLLVMWVGWETTDVPVIAQVSDGTTTYSVGNSNITIRTKNAHTTANLVCGQFCYFTAANTGSLTFTVTLSDAAVFKQVHIREYSDTGTPTLDADSVTADGTTAAVTSGTIAAVAGALVVGGVASDGSRTHSVAPAIGGTAASNALGSGTAAHTFHRILSGAMASGAATVTLSSGVNWVASLLSLDDVSAGGGEGFVLVAN